SRITRAISTGDEGKVREFILIQTRGDIAPVIRSVAQDQAFQKRTVAGLAVWEKTDLAVARVGPTTLAVGTSSAVDELVQVRLGMQSDLKLTGPLVERFQALDRESAVRVI